MMTYLARAMRRALDQTRAGNLSEATQSITAALAGTADQPAKQDAGTVIDHDAGETKQAHRPSGKHARQAAGRLPLGDAIAFLRSGKRSLAAAGAANALRPRTQPEPVPDGARFETHGFSCAAGSRDYKLYVPARMSGRPEGLVVMLHGCTQDPDDFAAGTAMNLHAERLGLIVAYPEQEARHNASRCWNWFNPGDQQRGNGEPAIIAGIARKVASEFGVADGRVFVAGLSAGAAMATVLAETYPDVFAAAGVHSGLARGAARDVASAFAAMQGRGIGSVAHAPLPEGAEPARMIVFHGTADRTVHPSNGKRVLDVAMARLVGGGDEECVSGVARGRRFERLIVRDSEGAARVEEWSIEGAGHAWSGGNPAGSFTDAAGPDATAEFLRFFMTP